MPLSYNRIAGQSIERLAALSDGIFSVGMTLLVLDLHVPAREVIHGEADLLHALVGIGPQVVIYLMSFLTLGIFWVGQQTQLNYLERSSKGLTWVNLGFLFAVTLMPFSTRLLGEFPTYRIALIAYWLNLFLLGLANYLSWTCSTKLSLTKADMPADVPRAIQRRVLGYQALYAIGALLCIVGNSWSIAFIVLVQLTAVIALRR